MYFTINGKLTENFFILKALSLKYKNVSFASVDVNKSQVRILSNPYGFSKPKPKGIA